MLTIGNPMSYIEAFLGQPAYIERQVLTLGVDETARQVSLRLFNVKHGWLTVHECDDAVIAYAFTLTDRRLRFDLYASTFGLVEGLLGRRTYSQLLGDHPASVDVAAGAYNYAYSEEIPSGRNGRYLYFTLSTTIDGWSASGTTPLAVGTMATGSYGEDDNESTALSEAALGALEKFRSAGMPDTVAIFAENYDPSQLRGMKASGAVDYETLRRFGGEGPIGWRIQRQDAMARRSLRERLEERREKVRTHRGD